MTDLFTALAKKRKKSELPAPEKVSTYFTASKPSNSTLPKPHRAQVQKIQSQRVQSQKVHTQRIKPLRNQAKVKQQQAQTPAYRNEDFQFVTSVDNLGVNIIVRFKGTLIYQFLLPITDYELWQRMASSWAQRYEYMKMKVNPSCFMNDYQLVHTVVKTIMNILDTLFAEAQRTAMKEAQAQAQHQAQTRAQAQRQHRTQAQNRRM